MLWSAAGKVLGATYDIIDLGTLGGTRSEAYGINASGQVAGWSLVPGVSPGGHAFRTEANQPINPAIDDLGGGNTSAAGINDSGQVVGIFVAGNGSRRAFRTAPNQPINLTTDDLGVSGAETAAEAINNSGQVVGWGLMSIFTGEMRAFRTAANQPINAATDDLGTLAAPYNRSSAAADINDSGQVVGSAWSIDWATHHAFRTAANQPINPATDDLGTLGGTFSEAWGINDIGQVVGWADTSLGPNSPRHAFRTAANQPINPATDDLGTLGGAYSEAWGVNNSGQVVGAAWGGANGGHAFLYNGSGPMQDLNNLVDPASGWTLETAYGINDSGQIVGVGVIGGHEHAFLLTPTPEPSTFALLGIGVVTFFICGWWRRWRTG
jgi:probable HAF family extracellular repeat protein